MDKKELVITGIIVIIAVVAAGIIFAPSTSGQYTSIDILNKGDLGHNSTIYVKLTDGNKASLTNKTIHIKLTDDKNNVVYEESVKTHATGVAMAKLSNVSAGTYNLEVSFDGDENYTGCSISQKVKVVTGEVKDELVNSTLIQQTIEDIEEEDASSQSSDSSYTPSYVPSDSGSSDSRGSDDDYIPEYDPDGHEVLPEYDEDGNIIN